MAMFACGPQCSGPGKDETLAMLDALIAIFEETRFAVAADEVTAWVSHTGAGNEQVFVMDCRLLRSAKPKEAPGD